MSELRSESKHGEVTLYGDIVSVKITPDRRVWFRWEGKQARFADTGRKVSQGFSRAQKEVWLVKYRHMLLERFVERGYTEKDLDSLAAQQRASEEARASEAVEAPVRRDGDDDGGDVVEDEDEVVDDPEPPPPRPQKQRLYKTG